jgi:hypothetical protein
MFSLMLRRLARANDAADIAADLEQADLIGWAVGSVRAGRQVVATVVDRAVRPLCRAETVAIDATLRSRAGFGATAVWEAVRTLAAVSIGTAFTLADTQPALTGRSGATLRPISQRLALPFLAALAGSAAFLAFLLAPALPLLGLGIRGHEPEHQRGQSTPSQQPEAFAPRTGSPGSDECVKLGSIHESSFAHRR